MPQIAPWFPNAKLGIFVHWGVFKTMFKSDTKTDWPMRGLPKEEYERRAKLLTGEHFDMAKWADMFKSWGARYAVLTTSHSMGFALWDTKVQDRSIVKMSPYGKDVVAQWCDELRKRDMKVGIYFCHRDWGDPDFCADMDREGYNEPDPVKRAEAWERYIVKRDTKIGELLENYGKIDLFWADEDWGRTPEQLRSAELASQILRRQPEIVMNNRFCHPYVGHYGSPEQQVPINPMTVPFEACDNLTDASHWQHVSEYYEYKPAGDVLRCFIDTIALGGNYLINVGPRPDGSIPEEEIAIMDYVGEFCRENAEAIYDTTAGLPRSCFGGGSTRKGNCLYLFAVDKPRGELVIHGLANKVTRVTRLTTGEQLEFRHSGGRGAGYYWITTPEDTGDKPVVYKVEFEGKKIELQKK